MHVMPSGRLFCGTVRGPDVVGELREQEHSKKTISNEFLIVMCTECF